MVEPGTTVGAADDTAVVEPAAPAASVPAASGRGWSSYSNNKKLAIGGGVGAVVGLGIYVWRKRRANNAVAAANPPPSSSSATGAGNTAPMYVLPSSNQDAVQGANDAALETALGSIGTTLNSIGNDVNNPPPPNVNTNVHCNCPNIPAGVQTSPGPGPCNCPQPVGSTDAVTGQPIGSLADAVALGGGAYLQALANEKNNVPPTGANPGPQAHPIFTGGLATLPPDQQKAVLASVGSRAYY